jgi:hypothetical protein
MLLDCWEAFEEVDNDANNDEPSNQDSEGDPDEHTRLNYERTIARSRTEANEGIIQAQREHIEDLRVDAVCCCFHNEIRLLTRAQERYNKLKNQHNQNLAAVRQEELEKFNVLLEAKEAEHAKSLADARKEIERLKGLLEQEKAGHHATKLENEARGRRIDDLESDSFIESVHSNRLKSENDVLLEKYKKSK